MILAKIRRDAESYLASRLPKPVITVPAYLMTASARPRRMQAALRG